MVPRSRLREARGETMMTPAQLETLQRLATAATPGPWTVQGPWPHATIYSFETEDRDVEGCHIASSPLILSSGQACKDDPDFAFISAARSAVPALLADVRELREGLSKALALIAIDASYADEPGIGVGMRIHARDCRAKLAALRQLLGGAE
jgi:hypothetical protein